MSEHIPPKSLNQPKDFNIIAESAKEERSTVQSTDLAKEALRVAEQARNERYISDTKDRQWLAEWSTTIVTSWLALVIFILCRNNTSFHLSDTVLSVLLGTTTLNVLGLIFIVLRGHFDSSNK